MTKLFQDVRYGFRTLRKNAGFTAVALVTLALGIGASTAIFSVAYGVLLRPLPYNHPDQIVRLWEVSAKGQRMNFADPNFEDLRAQSHSLQGLAEFTSGPQSVSGGSQPVRTVAAVVSRDFFSIMRVQPVLGRGFAPEDHRFGAAPVALVGAGYWKQFLGGATDLSAIKLTMFNRSVSVIGVLPPGFGFPDNSEIWVPRELSERLPSRDAHNWHVIGRLRDGVKLAQAHAEFATIARQLKLQYGQYTMMMDVAEAELRDEMASPVRPALIVLLGAVGFLLLVACLNVANLLLAHATARQRELAIRIAIGASRIQLISQFLIEALLLSITGGALGVLVTHWALAGLVKLAPTDLPRVGNVSINLSVLAFALGISLMVAISLGVFSALRAVSESTQHGLSESGRSQIGAPRNERIGRSIIVGQLAITLTLLTGAGLLGRSLRRVLSVDPGFRTEQVLTMDLSLTFAAAEKDKLHRVQFLSELLSELHALPGVADVGGTGALPLTGRLADGTYVVLAPGQQPPRTMDELGNLLHTSPHTGYAAYCPVSEEYFHSLGIPLLRGRVFDDRDHIEAPHVAVISESLAREKWPNQDPIGRTIEFGNMDGDPRPLTVVGVVGNIRAESLEADPQPTIYVSYRQRPQATYRFTAVIRTASNPAPIISSAREIVRRLDPNVPPEFGTFVGIVSASLQARRFNLILVGFFAAAALLLAVVGLYGVMAYAVTRRTREIGVRIALGATPAKILSLVLKQGARVTAVGVVIGVLGSFLLTRAIRSLLFGLSPTDPLTFVGVAILLVLVALLACFIPARRAAKVDPVVVLRYE
jgi:putative ABC transport system permease protein